VAPTSLSASDAARTLGVTTATLYAYVSRGLIRSEPGADGRRRRYRADDVEQLISRRVLRRDPAAAVQDALHWGAPVLDSALTLIRDGRLYYRGRDAAALATRARLEDVAALLWLNEEDAGSVLVQPAPPPPPLPRVDPPAPLLEAFQTALAAAGSADVAAADPRPAGAARSGIRILRLLAALATATPPSPAPAAETLSRAWTGGDAFRPLLDTALILCADHELNVSSFTVRCVASAGATPYAAVIAGLSALSGHRHGGVIERVSTLFEDAAGSGAGPAVAALLRRGENVPGFGHRLYPGGDVRADVLLKEIRDRCPDPGLITPAERVMDLVHTSLDLRPTIDAALAVLVRALALPREAAFGLFAIGRTVGWIAHTIEEQQTNRLIRPRARYTGPNPLPIRDAPQ
jgi:citrate synthase